MVGPWGPGGSLRPQLGERPPPPMCPQEMPMIAKPAGDSFIDSFIRSFVHLSQVLLEIPHHTSAGSFLGRPRRN